MQNRHPYDIISAKEKQAAAKRTFVFRAQITSKGPKESDGQGAFIWAHHPSLLLPQEAEASGFRTKI
jgi:hypothetical protein